MVSIAAFQAVDPSSILGHRRFFPLTYFDSMNKCRNINVELLEFYAFLLTLFAYIFPSWLDVYYCTRCVANNTFLIWKQFKWKLQEALIRRQLKELYMGLRRGVHFFSKIAIFSFWYSPWPLSLSSKVVQPKQMSWLTRLEISKT